MNTLMTVSKRFQMPPHLAGCTLDDIEMMMAPDESVYCAEFLRSGGNGSKAGAAVRRLNQDIDTSGRTRKNLQSLESSKSRDMLLKPTVCAFLYLKLKELREKAELDSTRSLEAYIREYESIRTLAKENEDYGAALRAHKELGVLYGHTESNTGGVDLNDIQLIRLIAGDNALLGETLSKQLGVSYDDVIEGELSSS